MSKQGTKTIELTKPLVYDVRKALHKKVSQFESPDTFRAWLKKNFGYDKWDYDGKHRYGLDSSTDVSDITYDMLEEGMELFCHIKPKGCPRISWYPVRIIHKYHNMVFYQCLVDNYISYVDCGADDYDWRKIHEKFEPALPIHMFAPIEVIVPEYADVKAWCLPPCVQITNVKE